jgi:parvulin-like peptidyl-prolyl isomerase
MRLSYTPIVLVLALFVAGCGGGAASLNATDVATVGSQHVTKIQFNQALSQQQASLKKQGQVVPKAGTTQYAALKTQVLSGLIQNAEFENEAGSLGVKVTDKDVQTQLDTIKKQYFGGSETRYKQQLKTQGYTDAEVRAQIRMQLLSQALFNKVTANVKATTKDIHAYYLAHKSQYPPTRAVEEILVGKNKQALAQSIYSQVKGGGNFAALAKKYSQDPGSKNIGGKFTAQKGKDVPEFDKAVFSGAKTGSLLSPVDTAQYGWFVIKILGDAKPTPEAQVAPTIGAQVEQQQRNQQMSDWVSKTAKNFCQSGKIKYQAGYQPNPDPCTALAAATNTTTT